MGTGEVLKLWVLHDASSGPAHPADVPFLRGRTMTPRTMVMLEFIDPTQDYRMVQLEVGLEHRPVAGETIRSRDGRRFGVASVEHVEAPTPYTIAHCRLQGARMPIKELDPPGDGSPTREG